MMSKQNNTLYMTLTVIVVALVGGACQQAGNHSDGNHAGTHSAAPAQASTTPRIPDYHKDIAAARPLPKTLPPEQFKSPSVVKSYQIAQQYPDVLAQQPCYCYCDTGFGHKSLLDCHIDTHSAECMVCMKEAILAGQMHQEGKSAEQIRAAIIREEWKTVALQ